MLRNFAVADVMSKGRCEKLSQYFHLNDKWDEVAPNDDPSSTAYPQQKQTCIQCVQHVYDQNSVMSDVTEQSVPNALNKKIAS